MPGSSYSDYLFDPMRLPKPFGLVNYGNTCWLNAFTQMLISLEPFNRMIAEARPAKKSVIPAYLAVFNGNIAKFRELFSSFGMNTSLQQCADEALALFIDSIQLTPATGMMRLVVKAEIACPCGYSATIPDYSYRNMIYPPPVVDDTDFTQRLLGKRVPLNGFNCERCGQPITLRLERLSRVENIIIIAFQQYTGKYQHYFPREFTLPSIDGRGHTFRLVAQIEHAGSTAGGHYWARVLRQDGVYLINDSSVSPSQFQPSAETYMLAYCRTT